MDEEFELRKLEERCRELRVKLEAENAPLDPARTRATLRIMQRQISILEKICLEAHPKLCEKFDLAVEIPF